MEKVSRLREFLSWKDVRKNVKDNSYDEIDAEVDKESPRQKFISFFWDSFSEFIPDGGDAPIFDDAEHSYDLDRLKVILFELFELITRKRILILKKCQRKNICTMQNVVRRLLRIRNSKDLENGASCKSIMKIKLAQM